MLNPSPFALNLGNDRQDIIDILQEWSVAYSQDSCYWSLVYMLENQYWETYLRFDNLRGNDLARVKCVRQAC